LYGTEILSIEEDLKIGEAGGDEDYMFTQIRYLAVDHAENIYVADIKKCKLKSSIRMENISE